MSAPGVAAHGVLLTLSRPGNLAAALRAAPPLAVVGILAAVTIAGVAIDGLSYDGRDGLDLTFALAALWWLVGAAVARVPGAARLGEIMRAMALFSAMALLTTLASAVLAVGSPGYVDAALAATDATLLPGFDWRASVLALAAHPPSLAVLSYAYVSLNWQPPLLFVLMALAARTRPVSVFLSAWSIALLACLAPFHWLSARSAYPHFGIDHARVPGVLTSISWDCARLLYGFRSGAIGVLDRHTVVGLVTIPSFHGCAAILLGWAFWPSRLRWPAAVLNAAMFVSAVPIGGHYLVDLLTGGAVAVASIGLAQAYERRLARSFTPSP